MVQTGGDPSGEQCMSLCIVQKEFNLGQTGLVFCLFVFTSGMFDISSGSFLLTPDWCKGNKHLAYRTCSFARFRGGAYV